MKWLLTALLISGLALAQDPPAEGPQTPAQETQPSTEQPASQPSAGEPAQNETEPTDPDAQPTDPATNPAENPADTTENPEESSPGEVPAEPPKDTPVAPKTETAPETPGPVTPETPSMPPIKIQVTVPEALQQQFKDALKVFSHARVPLEAEFATGADSQFLTETDIPFNPDAGSRTLVSGSKRQVWINTSSTLSQELIWRVETAKLLKLPDPIVLPRERTLTEQDKQALKTQFASKGDLNGDDRVDLLDLIILAKNMGVENPSKGDLNQDGRVDDQDVAQLKELYTR